MAYGQGGSSGSGETGFARGKVRRTNYIAPQIFNIQPPPSMGEVTAGRRGFSLKSLLRFTPLDPAASRPPFHPRGSVSLDSQSPAAPCESSSLATTPWSPSLLKRGGWGSHNPRRYMNCAPHLPHSHLSHHARRALPLSHLSSLNTSL